MVNEKIAALMRLKGVRQSRVSELVRINRSNLNSYLNGNSDLRSEGLIRVLKVIGIDVERVLSEKIHESLEGKRLEVSSGKEIQEILDSLEKIDRKTLLETIISKGKEAPEPNSDAIRTLEEKLRQK